MILTAFSRALGQLPDPRFRHVLLLGIGLTIALLFGATVVFVGLVTWLLGESVSLPFIGEVTWLSSVLGWSTVVAMFVLSFFLMVPVASAITSMFLDRVAQAVEDRHYPHLPRAREVALGDALRDTFGFLGVLVVANMVALVAYLMFAPFAPLIFWSLNGFLLGREYFTLVAMRRLGRAGAIAMRKRHAGVIWMAGILMAVPLTVPLVNLLIPVLGAATFTHLFHALAAKDPSGP